MSSHDQPAGEHAPDSAWTLGRLLNWTTDFLKQRGSDSAQLDAQLLLAHARKCQRIELFTAYGELASDALRSEFRELVRRRAAGEPVAYLVGHREFYSLDFRVTRDVLIPRPETEFLVIAALDLLKKEKPHAVQPLMDADLPELSGALTIADVGTGSGILAVCLAKQLPDARIWATDTSDDALNVAARIARRMEYKTACSCVAASYSTRYRKMCGWIWWSAIHRMFQKPNTPLCPAKCAITNLGKHS